MAESEMSQCYGNGKNVVVVLTIKEEVFRQGIPEKATEKRHRAFLQKADAVMTRQWLQPLSQGLGNVFSILAKDLEPTECLES